MSLADGIGHDDECEWASEACGCDSRKVLRDALLAAVAVVKVWHNMGMTREAANRAWAIYYFSAPEMLPIRSLLNLKEAP